MTITTSPIPLSPTIPSLFVLFRWQSFDQLTSLESFHSAVQVAASEAQFCYHLSQSDIQKIPATSSVFFRLRRVLLSIAILVPHQALGNSLLFSNDKISFLCPTNNKPNDWLTICRRAMKNIIRKHGYYFDLN